MLKRLLHRPWFSAPICDEVALLGKASVVTREFPDELNEENLLEITARHGIDMASACLYVSLMKSVHGEFKRTIDALPISSTNASKIKILIVPGMFHDIHPETGADGGLIRELAESAGIDVALVETCSLASVAENAERIAEKVILHSHQPVWLISFSKGAGEVRRYLQSFPVPMHVSGWINVAGIYGGTPYVDRMLASRFSRFYYRAICKLHGLGYQALSDLKASNLMWRATQWPEHVEIIHIVPVPLKSHLQTHLIKRHAALEQYGPNDGCVPLSQVLCMPGRIYPIWGADHFMRSAEIPGLMYRLLHYISKSSINVNCSTHNQGAIP